MAGRSRCGWSNAGSSTNPSSRSTCRRARWITRYKLLRNKGDLKGALRAIGRALEGAPGRAERLKLLVSRASTLRASGDHWGAINDLNEILAARPRNVNALRTRSLSWFELGRYQPAKADCEAILGISTASQKRVEGARNLLKGIEEHLQHRARSEELLRSARGQSDDKALALVEQACRTDPRHAAAHLELGRLRLALGHVRPALVALSRSVWLDPRQAQAHYLRGRARERVGQRKQARADFEEALERCPAEDVPLRRTILAALGR